jgi:hypothetical protein
MFCTQCGSPNLEDAQVCRYCRAPLVKKEGDTMRFEPKPTGERPGGSYTSSPPSSDPAPGPYPGYGASGSGQQMPPGYQPYPGYQASYAAYSPPLPASASGRAIAAMILSIIGIFACGPFTSIPGMILGKVEMNAIRDGQAPPAGETYAKVGFYLGIAGTAIYCLLGGLWAALFTAGMMGSIAP